MKPHFLTAALLTGLNCVMPSFASAQVWSDVSAAPITAKPGSGISDTLPWARKVRTDTESLKFILSQAPHERLGMSDSTIDLPLPDGGVATFILMNSPIMESGLMQKFPDMQTYRVVDKTQPQNTGRLDFTSRGFRGMFLYNGETVYIEPADDQTGYHTYYESDYTALEPEETSEGFTCGVDEHETENTFTPAPQNKSSFETPQKISLGENLRVYRMAVATTGEYTQDVGGGTVEGGIAAVLTAINRVNVFFERDVAIRFTLIANNDALIFTDPDTDPFPENTSGGILEQSHTVIVDGVGVESFDIGHVFGNNGGGIASRPSVCAENFKGRGVTGTNLGRSSEVRFINVLAHEMGHQFSAHHSFNGSTNSCANQRSTVANVEPHSGITFMSYIGICGAENVATSRGRFFHNFSMTQITDYVASSNGGGSCGSLLPTSNTGPVIDAGADGTIPISTPFTLSGTASDADGDALLHIWEQVDSGTPNADVDDFADEGTRALFRSFEPNPSLSRTFPQLERVLAGDRVIGEVLPSTDRDLTFRMTTRDGFGGVADDERIISVTTTAGPFTIETPSATSIEAGVAHTVTWDVANTSAAPVSCEFVNLSLSTDGGNSFTQTLAASTPNDGSETVVFPNVTTSTARLKASCTTQPFFAINDADFTMTPMIIINAAPNAVADSASIVEDSRRASINVLENDTDPEGDTITLVSVTQPSQGGAAEVSGAFVLYTPVIGFVGSETFTYTIDDGNDNTATATVTLDVTAKPNTPPVLQDAAITVAEDSAQTLINVIANATDADDDTLTLEAVGTPSAGGSVSIVDNQISYAPALEFSGTETFTYTVNDGEGGVVSANVTITVTPRPNIVPIAENVVLTVEQDSSATLIDAVSSASDADGDLLTLSAVSTPSQGGSASLLGGQISYAPALGYSGEENFTYTVSDGEGGEATASVVVTVRVNTAQVVTQVATAELNSSSGGGGAFGPFLLLLLGLRTAITTLRQRSSRRMKKLA